MASFGSYADKLKKDSETLTCDKPVFIKNIDIPSEEIGTVELCELCEKITGHDTMEAAQPWFNGLLWRLYPKNEDARATLLVSGLNIQGVSVPLYNRNPFLMHDSDGQEVPSTRITISHVPLSASNDDMISAIEAQGVTFLSKMRYELARDKNNRLTRFKNGRRYAFIAVPTDPLPRRMKVGAFQLEIYHKEQRLAIVQKSRECFNCLNFGHHAANCENPVKCKDCRKDGHKAGDPSCGWVEQAALFESRIQQDADTQALAQSDHISISSPEKEVDKPEEEMLEDIPTPEEEGAPEEGTSASSTPQASSESERKADKSSKTKSIRGNLREFVFKKSKRTRDNEDDASSSSKKAAINLEISEELGGT